MEETNILNLEFKRVPLNSGSLEATQVLTHSFSLLPIDTGRENTTAPVLNRNKTKSGVGLGSNHRTQRFQGCKVKICTVQKTRKDICTCCFSWLVEGSEKLLKIFVDETQELNLLHRQ